MGRGQLGRPLEPHKSPVSSMSLCSHALLGLAGRCRYSEDLYVSERNQCPAWDKSCHARKAGWDGLTHHGGPRSKRVTAGCRLWQNRLVAWWWHVALEALPCHSSFPRGTMTVSSSTLQGRIQKLKVGPLGGHLCGVLMSGWELAATGQ